MTTSNEWGPDPTTVPTTTVPPATPQFESTPIADELSATNGDSPTDGPSVKDRAQDTVDTAKQHGSDVASTAADEAKQVAGEAKAKATDLLSDVKAQVDEQSRTQLQGLAAKIGELGDELDGLIRGDGTSEGAVTDMARQLSDRTRALSNHLADREPAQLVADVRSFARRRPGTFLIGAAAAGLVAGRLTRGAKAANDQAGSPQTQTPAPAASVGSAPTPVPAGAGTYAADVAATTSAEVPSGQNTGGRQ
jgi:ElaB/YqjD/DUF883 family membrane-anchored ribosome-binding protein